MGSVASGCLLGFRLELAIAHDRDDHDRVCGDGDDHLDAVADGDDGDDYDLDRVADGADVDDHDLDSVADGDAGVDWCQDDEDGVSLV